LYKWGKTSPARRRKALAENQERKDADLLENSELAGQHLIQKHPADLLRYNHP
jgi:hypothetical protein